MLCPGLTTQNIKRVGQPVEDQAGNVQGQQHRGGGCRGQIWQQTLVLIVMVAKQVIASKADPRAGNCVPVQVDAKVIKKPPDRPESLDTVQRLPQALSTNIAHV